MAVIFFAVVPRLRANLEEQALRDLDQASRTAAATLQSARRRDLPGGQLDAVMRAVAEAADAEVALLGVGGRRGDDVPVYAIADSRVRGRIAPTYGVAVDAAREDRTVRGVATRDGETVGQVAVPLDGRRGAREIALLSRSLAEVDENVALIRRQVLAAGLAALVVALVGGVLIAGRLAQRVRRLETAAREVAAGRFTGPLPVDSEDELGRLTRTFNEMQEQLSRVEGARRDFIANASHELRTPIHSLGGFVELLQDEELDEGTREEFLTQMREQVERLQRLAADLLDLSRIDGGGLLLHPERVDLGGLARTVVGEFGPAIDRHGANLHLSLPERGVAARCDPVRTAQIMRILVDNALRHTPAGTEVEVAAVRENGHAEFRVADAGPGVPAPASERVFDRFYTADAARGSGLGLAIAKELAERMRGRVELRSRPGRTTFTLTLPVGDDGRSEDGVG